MLYAIIAYDKPDGLALRNSTRPAHLDYLTQVNSAIVLAGRMLDDNGDANGSLLVVKADDLAAATAIADGDPFAQAGLFASRKVTPWNWAINRPPGLA